MLIAACKPTVPKDIIQPEDMEDLLCDYYLAKAMGMQLGDRDENSDYRQNLYVEGAFRKHGVTQAEFDSSMVYYYAHANYLEDIYQRVSERLEKQAMALGANEGELGRYAVLNANGDTANIWAGRTNILLSPHHAINCFLSLRLILHHIKATFSFSSSPAIISISLAQRMESLSLMCILKKILL